MFYSKEQLINIGFKALGENVLISDKCSIYNPQNISIGNNVRIDDFCILSASKEIKIYNNIHIACKASLIGKESIILNDFSGISMGCSILSSSANFSGEFMTNPNLKEDLLDIDSKPIILDKHSIVGAHSVLLPGAYLEQGVVIGAMSIVKKRIPYFEIWAGNPLKFIKKRSENLLKLEDNMNV